MTGLAVAAVPWLALPAALLTAVAAWLRWGRRHPEPPAAPEELSDATLAAVLARWEREDSQ